MRSTFPPISAILLLSLAHPASAEPWPQFLGPNVTGISEGQGEFSHPAGFHLREAWKIPIGSGSSAVVVSDGVASTLFSDGENDVIAAFDAETGREKWRYPIEPVYRGHDGSFDGPSSTPLIVDGIVVGLSARGRLLALQLATGELIWSKDLAEDFGSEPSLYGYASSPILVEGSVILQTGSKTSSVVALDPASGDVRWAVAGDRAAYQTPVPVRLHGELYVAALGESKLRGIDPKTGTTAWEFEHGASSHARGVNSAVPVAADSERFFLKQDPESSAMVVLSRDGDAIVGEQTWMERSIRNTYSVALFFEEHLYGFSSRFLACVDPADGRTVWKSRAPGDGFPIIVDGHLVVLTKDGGLHVAKAGPSGYAERAAVQLFDDVVWNSPAYVDGSFYARSLGELARVDVERGPVQISEAGPADADASESGFEAMLAEARGASDPGAVVDRYMAAQRQFPVHEGRELVHFLYRGPGEDLAIAGDFIGARQERRMTRFEGADLFYYSVRLDADARVSYLFLRDYEPITDPLNPRASFSELVGPDMEVGIGQDVYTPMSALPMQEWHEPEFLRDPQPNVARGRVVDAKVDSEVLGRKHGVKVYLPPDYGESDHRYRTVYIHGGQPALKFSRIPQSLDQLIAAGQEPVIAVFIDAVAPPETSEYVAMWAQELVPAVDRDYRTVSDRAGRAHWGTGPNDAFAILCALRRPDLAAGLALQTPVSSFFMRGLLEPEIRSSQAADSLRVYLDWGRYDLFNPHEGWDMREWGQTLSRKFRESGFQVTGGEVPAGSGWVSWRTRTDVVLRELFPAEE